MLVQFNIQCSPKDLCIQVWFTLIVQLTITVDFKQMDLVGGPQVHGTNSKGIMRTFPFYLTCFLIQSLLAVWLQQECEIKSIFSSLRLNLNPLILSYATFTRCLTPIFKSTQSSKQNLKNTICLSNFIVMIEN